MANYCTLLHRENGSFEVLCLQGVESDAVRWHEAYPAEDVELDLISTAMPDDEFPEEPHIKEAQGPRRDIQSGKVGSRACSQESGDIPARSCVVALYEMAERIRLRCE